MDDNEQQLQDIESSLPENNDANTILIIDDELVNVFMLSEMLKNLQYRSNYAYNGTDGIRLEYERCAQIRAGQSESGMYKLVLLDFSMGDINGP